MTDKDIKINCLELALQIAPDAERSHPGKFYTNIANDFYEFVKKPSNVHFIEVDIIRGPCNHSKKRHTSVEEENQHIEGFDGGLSEYIEKLLASARGKNNG